MTGPRRPSRWKSGDVVFCINVPSSDKLNQMADDPSAETNIDCGRGPSRSELVYVRTEKCAALLVGLARKFAKPGRVVRAAAPGTYTTPGPSEGSRDPLPYPPEHQPPTVPGSRRLNQGEQAELCRVLDFKSNLSDGVSSRAAARRARFTGFGSMSDASGCALPSTRRAVRSVPSSVFTARSEIVGQAGSLQSARA